MAGSTPDIRIHRAGWPFVAIALILAVAGAVFSLPLGLVLFVLAGWVAYFFRDPERVTPPRPGLVVSPADGIVCMITDAAPPAEMGLGPQPRPRVSIFLNVFDVHVNRVPIAGTVGALHYHPGKFVNAALDKASTDNERMAARIVLPNGAGDVVVVQIAGLIARRILCYLKEGQFVRTGERYGIIRFGSRTDVYLPPGAVPQVLVGQRAVGGETVIADLGG